MNRILFYGLISIGIQIVGYSLIVSYGNWQIGLGILLVHCAVNIDINRRNR